MKGKILERKKAAGVLLHPTSLPSPHGIGDLGCEAYRFVDFLARGKQQLWQMLPLNPPGYGESPYQAYSAFAGNTWLISLKKLYEDGLLTREELTSTPEFSVETVDYTKVREIKETLLRRAYNRYVHDHHESAFDSFMEANRYWVEDYALFMALRRHFSALPWREWERGAAFRESEPLLRYKKLLADDIAYQQLLQFAFHKQWMELKKYAESKEIRIIGDLPLYISGDSCDVWTKPELFALDKEGNPAYVAGVPPDYFSATGQRWGNPQYRWPLMEEDDYAWWRARVAKLLEWVDYIRIDHFRGLEAYWEIPAQEETAIHGRWVKGPGKKFFSVLQKYLGQLPFLAEDLGYITTEVIELKEEFAFPGMRIFQFIDREEWLHRPPFENTAYYTGTHDNDTIVGWYQENVLKQLHTRRQNQDMSEIAWEIVQLIYQSNALWAIIPLQDLLGLDNKARMNIPGTAQGNWRWRFVPGSLTDEISDRLASLTINSCRR